MLSVLSVNRSLMREFIEADTPCFALGLVEEQGQQYGFLALRPGEEIPPEILDDEASCSIGYATITSTIST